MNTRDRLVIFDTETTGLSFKEGHKIVEIGAVVMIDGRISQETFHQYVNPGRDIPQEAINVHGLTEEFLENSPFFNDPSVGQAFVNFVGDSDLVAHNGISFDLPFINSELRSCGLKPISNKLHDTLHIARKKFPGSPANLDFLCSRFGISTAEREKHGHGALLDSELLAKVYIHLTGGIQRGFELAPNKENRSHAKISNIIPIDFISLITEEEAAAHDKFIETLGEDCMWKRLR